MPMLPRYATPGARNLGGLYNQPGMPPMVPPTQPSGPAPLGDMSAIDEAVRRFNETAANLPVGAFAPGGNFWARQAAGLAANRQAATNEANDWINQQVGQRMPGGVAPGPEAGRLGLSADPRYGAQFPQAAPAPQIDQGLVDQANAAAPGFIHVGKHSGLQPLLPETWETGPVDGLTPAAAAALRERQLRQRLASDPQYQEWKAAAQAAGADAMAKGLPGPQLKGPTFVGDAFRSEADQARFKAAADAFADRRADRRDRLMAQMEQRRAAAAINNLRDPQTRNAVLAAGLFGGQMPQNAAIALQMMGYPDAAKFVAQSQLAAQESADRRYGVDRGVEVEQWRAYNRDLENWREDQKEYNKQVNALMGTGPGKYATREQAQEALGQMGITLRPRPVAPGGAPAPQQVQGGDSDEQTAQDAPSPTLKDRQKAGQEFFAEGNTTPQWFAANYDRLQSLSKAERKQILRQGLTTEQVREFLAKGIHPDADPSLVAAAKELSEVFGVPVETRRSYSAQGAKWFHGGPSAASIGVLP